MYSTYGGLIRGIGARDPWDVMPDGCSDCAAADAVSKVKREIIDRVDSQADSLADKISSKLTPEKLKEALIDVRMERVWSSRQDATESVIARCGEIPSTASTCSYTRVDQTVPGKFTFSLSGYGVSGSRDTTTTSNSIGSIAGPQFTAGKYPEGTKVYAVAVNYTYQYVGTASVAGKEGTTIPVSGSLQRAESYKWMVAVPVLDSAGNPVKDASGNIQAFQPARPL